MKNLICVYFLLAFSVFLGAQTAEKLEIMLNTGAISYEQAAWLSLEAADVWDLSGSTESPDAYEAFVVAQEQQWLNAGIGSKDYARLDAVSLLLMRSFGLKGGMFYSLAQNPHYAYRELVYQEIIQGRTEPGMNVSGDMLVFMVNRILSSLEGENWSPVASIKPRGLNDNTAGQSAAQHARSGDFGVILDLNAGYGGYGSKPDFNYSGMIIPRFSTLIGSSGEFYISAGFKAEYSESWSFIPELLRTEFTWSFDGGALKAGRMHYSDPLGFVADGLFDGFRLSFDTDAGTFGAGAWYTGFLYKKRANIAMSTDDLSKLGAEFKYDDFFNTYFASRRVMAAFNWYHPGIAELVRVDLALLGQFDLNDPDKLADGIHSLYISGNVTIPFNFFTLSFGPCFELAQMAGDLNFALAGELGVAIDLPTPLEDQLTILGRYSSGNWEDSSFIAFMPLTNKNMGELLKPKFSGISLISLNYLARLNRTMSVEGSSTYFIRNDLGTYPLYGTEGYFLGNEFFARFYWSPFSDMQLNLGAGVFLPSLGNAAPKTDILWRAELNLILSLF